MKKKMTLNTYCYDCGHLFINFSFFELLGKFYCFIMKRKNAPMPILETELTDTLANDHFDDWYGAALNLPMCNRVKKEEKALCLAVVFDELFGGGSLLRWFEVEADFLRTFFCKYFDCHCVGIFVCPLINMSRRQD